MLSLKLAFLVRWMHCRAGGGEGLSAKQLGNIADDLEELLPQLQAIENRRIPFAVIRGSKNGDPAA